MSDRDVLDRLRRMSSALTPPEPAHERLLARRDRKRRNDRLASAAVAMVVVIAGFALAVVAFVGHGRGVGHGTGFSGSGSSGLVAGPGQYYYWKTERVMSSGPNVVEQMWWAEDGSGRYVVDQGNPSYGVMSDRTWAPSEFPGRFPFETDLSRLSTNPDQLRQQLLGRSASSGASPEPEATIAPTTSPDSSALLRAGTNILQMGNASPSLRVAMYEVLSQLPEATIGNADDPVGRPSVTVSFKIGDAYGGGTQTLSFDPNTHLLLAMDGGLSGQFIVLDGGIVDSTQATPAAGERLLPRGLEPAA